MRRTYLDIIAGFNDARAQYPDLEVNRCCIAISYAAITHNNLVNSTRIIHEHTGDIPGRVDWERMLKVYTDTGYVLKPFHTFKAKTVRTLERELKHGKYLVACSRYRHALAIIDGHVVDWAQNSVRRINYVWRLAS